MSKVNKSYKELLEERDRTLSIVESLLEEINNLINQLAKPLEDNNTLEITGE